MAQLKNLICRHQFIFRFLEQGISVFWKNISMMAKRPQLNVNIGCKNNQWLNIHTPLSNAQLIDGKLGQSMAAQPPQFCHHLIGKVCPYLASWDPKPSWNWKVGARARTARHNSPPMAWLDKSHPMHLCIPDLGTSTHRVIDAYDQYLELHLAIGRETHMFSMAMPNQLQ